MKYFFFKGHEIFGKRSVLTQSGKHRSDFSRTVRPTIREDFSSLLVIRICLTPLISPKICQVRLR